LTIADVSHMRRAAHAADTPTLARVPRGDVALAAAALDCGVDGLIFAAVDDVQAARACVAATRYPPGGVRGVSFYTAAGRYTTRDREEALSAGRAGPFTMMQIESRAGLAEVEAIAELDGVGGLFFGPTDYGVESAGDDTAASVEDAAKAVLAAAKGAGKLAGTFIADAAAARGRFVDGFALVTVGVVPLTARALGSFLAEARG
jgi:4-hydroxy-2-oxoheptanedioate aldolase